MAILLNLFNTRNFLEETCIEILLLLIIALSVKSCDVRCSLKVSTKTHYFIVGINVHRHDDPSHNCHLRCCRIAGRKPRCVDKLWLHYYC